jgi:hypothetical protein
VRVQLSGVRLQVPAPESPVAESPVGSVSLTETRPLVDSKPTFCTESV